MSNKAVRQFACGIMYNQSFKLLDYWGAIADSILYKNSYFSPEYFPSISTNYTIIRSLSNSDHGHSIQLTANNLIYTHVVQNDFEAEYEEFRTRMSKFLVPRVIEEYSLVTRRIGVVFSCAVSEKGIESFADKYFKPECKKVTDFRFSKKEPTAQGASFSDKSDFINKIYTVGALGENFSGISFDYQSHYVPPRADITKQIDQVLKKGKEILEKEILSLGE